jgi:hypothetical protein
MPLMVPLLLNWIAPPAAFQGTPPMVPTVVLPN